MAVEFARPTYDSVSSSQGQVARIALEPLAFVFSVSSDLFFLQIKTAN